MAFTNILRVGAVVTFSAMSAQVRDFIRKRYRLLCDSATRPAMKHSRMLFVWLDVAEDELVSRNLARLNRFLQSSNAKPTDYWNSDFDPNVKVRPHPHTVLTLLLPHYMHSCRRQ